jgi:hypothetical protein
MRFFKQKFLKKRVDTAQTWFRRYTNPITAT